MSPSGNGAGTSLLRNPNNAPLKKVIGFYARFTASYSKIGTGEQVAAMLRRRTEIA